MPRVDGVFLTDLAQNLVLEGSVANIPFISGVSCKVRWSNPKLNLDSHPLGLRRRRNSILACAHQYHVIVLSRIFPWLASDLVAYSTEQITNTKLTFNQITSQPLLNLTLISCSNYTRKIQHRVRHLVRVTSTSLHPNTKDWLLSRGIWSSRFRGGSLSNKCRASKMSGPSVSGLSCCWSFNISNAVAWTVSKRMKALPILGAVSSSTSGFSSYHD